MNEILTDYQKSIRRGEMMIARYQVEHPTYDRPADLFADIMAYCEANDINVLDEIEVASLYLDDEKADGQ